MKQGYNTFVSKRSTVQLYILPPLGPSLVQTQRNHFVKRPAGSLQGLYCFLPLQLQNPPTCTSHFVQARTASLTKSSLSNMFVAEESDSLYSSPMPQ